MEILGGILMAFSNSVPGVSGGTIAFLLGFFDKMVDSINALISPKSKNKKQALFFLLRLGISWLVGFTAAVFAVTHVFENHIYAVSSLFIGFIIFSIPLVAYEERKILKEKYKNILWAIPGFVFVLAITLLSGSSLSLSSSVVKAILAIPAGALAISAMIMPGLSGSSLMMIFGLYMPIMEALKNLASLNFSGLPLILCFLVGAALGALGFVKCVRYLLNRFRAQTVYTVFGMMIASVYSIWVGPATLEPPKEIMSFPVFSIPFFLLGGAFIALIGVLKYFVDTRRTNIKKADEKQQNEDGTNGAQKTQISEKEEVQKDTDKNGEVPEDLPKSSGDGEYS